MDQIKLYLKSCRMLMKSQWQYRTSFIIQTISQLIMMGTELLAVIFLINRYSSVGQWNGGEILFFFGIIITSFYTTETFGRGITNFSALIGKGELDTLLIRPRNLLFQVLCSQADPRRFGAILIGIASLVMGCIQAHVTLSFTKIILLIWSVIGGSALVLGLFMIEATLCFFSVKSIEMVNVLTYGGRSTCQYPIDIYPRWLQLLFSVVAPFALTTHIPAAYILGKPLWNTGLAAAFIAPLSGFAFLALMTLVFYRGLRHYRSTGS
ncbi:MAG: ABC-2 family transporter protein [Clostridia bacterium]|nr:ABC-2 family transporter protein [Clostridia bacterium]